MASTQQSALEIEAALEVEWAHLGLFGEVAALVAMVTAVLPTEAFETLVVVAFETQVDEVAPVIAVMVVVAVLSLAW